MAWLLSDAASFEWRCRCARRRLSVDLNMRKLNLCMPWSTRNPGKPRMNYRTQADAASKWRGLEMKAENAIPFVDGMSQCDVLERIYNTITRVVTFRGSQRQGTHHAHVNRFRLFRTHGWHWLDRQHDQ